MNVSGRVTVAASRQAVWDALEDLEVLRRILPGCELLEPSAPDRFVATLTAGAAGAFGTYRGVIEVTDRDAPMSWRVTADGSGEPGTIRAAAVVHLAEDDGSTVVHYAVDADVTGRLAATGQRLLTEMVHRTAGDVLAALERELLAVPAAPGGAPGATGTGQRAAAPSQGGSVGTPVGGAATVSASGHGDVPSAPEGADPAGSRGRIVAAAGIAVGLAIAVAGIVLGRRRSP